MCQYYNMKTSGKMYYITAKRKLFLIAAGNFNSPLQVIDAARTKVVNAHLPQSSINHI